MKPKFILYIVATRFNR